MNCTDDLSGIPESGLLDMVQMILSKPGALSERDREELYWINHEFERRDRENARAARREQYAVRRTRQMISRRIEQENEP